MSDPKAARFPWGLTVASLFALVLLVSLGGWQVQRLQWKQDLIARAEAAADLPPISLEALSQMPDPEFRTAVLACDFQNQPYVELQSIQDGQPGVRLISSCKGWLVDLGFVPEAVSARPAQLPAAISAIIAEARRVEAPGAFAPPPEGNRFYARDTGAMSRALGIEGPVRPYVLFATGSAWPEWQALTPSAPPAAFSNNHLGYALTWFGLALALVGFYIALFRRKLTS
ncbi:MAG: SURF1 family protein [Brevundimonas sp.]|uniref:SURF1 family protein n=1 Tax=Brevundimonas sp. TaxID=1871086 RepID=UPI002732A20E|nr:SURF1 family protein [Brevundimonas sp.]MDP3377596.1 SURF1 family protein [Brevundimonas sp.]